MFYNEEIFGTKIEIIKKNINSRKTISEWVIGYWSRTSQLVHPCKVGVLPASTAK